MTVSGALHIGPSMEIARCDLVWNLVLGLARDIKTISSHIQNQTKTQTEDELPML